jgi:hypothetical protein
MKFVYPKTLDNFNHRMMILVIENFLKYIERKKLFVFIDESGFDRNKKKFKVWGKSVDHRTLANPTKGSNVSMISAISRDGIIHNQFYTTGVNGKIFDSFLSNVISSLKLKYP